MDSSPEQLTLFPDRPELTHCFVCGRRLDEHLTRKVVVAEVWSPEQQKYVKEYEQWRECPK
jgi:hypothetical protein